MQKQGHHTYFCWCKHVENAKAMHGAGTGTGDQVRGGGGRRGRKKPPAGDEPFHEHGMHRRHVTRFARAYVSACAGERARAVRSNNIDASCTGDLVGDAVAPTDLVDDGDGDGERVVPEHTPNPCATDGHTQLCMQDEG